MYFREISGKRLTNKTTYCNCAGKFSKFRFCFTHQLSNKEHGNRTSLLFSGSPDFILARIITISSTLQQPLDNL